MSISIDGLIVGPPPFEFVTPPDPTLVVVPVGGPAGSAGPPGPEGPPGPDRGTEMRHQDTPAATWIFVHDFGRYVGVRIFSDEGVERYADISQIINQVTISFAEPNTGFVLLI